MSEQQAQQLSSTEQKALDCVLVGVTDAHTRIWATNGFYAGLAARVGCPDEGQRVEAAAKALYEVKRAAMGLEPWETLDDLARHPDRELAAAAVGAVAAAPDGGRAATHSGPKEDAILAAWQATSPALRSTPWLAFRSGMRAVAASPDEEHRDAIVLWTCSRCERVTRWHDGEEPPTCVGPYERDLSEAEHEPTPMLAVPLRAVAASPDALTGCTPCSDCGTDYAALTGAWLVSDECWQRFAGTDPSIVLCPRCFISRVNAVLSDG